MTSLIDFMSSDEFQRRMTESLKRIEAENRRLGLPKAVHKDGRLYREYPDGRLEEIIRPEAASEDEKS